MQSGTKRPTALALTHRGFQASVPEHRQVPRGLVWATSEVSRWGPAAAMLESWPGLGVVSRWRHRGQRE